MIYIFIFPVLLLSFTLLIRWYDRRQKKLSFEESFTQTHDFIMEADRFNVYDALKAGKLLEMTKDHQYNRQSKRMIDQELILWNSKFSRLFRKDNREQEAYIVANMI